MTFLPLNVNLGTNAANTKCFGSTWPNDSARARSFARAEEATQVRGMVRSPAAVLLLRIVRVRENRSTSDHCSPFNSQLLAVVFRQRIGRASCRERVKIS